MARTLQIIAFSLSIAFGLGCEGEMVFDADDAQVLGLVGEDDDTGGDGGSGGGDDTGDDGGDGGGDGGGGGGPPCNCCAGGDGVGCDCQPCEDTVCGADSFCCNVAWDSICDGEAMSMCNCCPGQNPGECDVVVIACNCCSGGDGVGCDCLACESEVCGVDVFCCDVAWDSVCDDEAQSVCTCCNGVCGGDFPGCNCCTGGDGVGCEDPACEDLVCGADSFCCDIAWDSICNDAASLTCSCC